MFSETNIIKMFLIDMKFVMIFGHATFLWVLTVSASHWLVPLFV